MQVQVKDVVIIKDEQREFKATVLELGKTKSGEPTVLGQERYSKDVTVTKWSLLKDVIRIQKQTA
jgi:hypothetical protein